jgi:hypothetical protein
VFFLKFFENDPPKGNSKKSFFLEFFSDQGQNNEGQNNEGQNNVVILNFSQVILNFSQVILNFLRKDKR